MTTAELFAKASPTRFDLAALMRSRKVTIRQLAARMGVTMTRVREVRAMDRVPYLTW
jgi:DNA-binding Xre family transcriptional regulator